MKRLTSSVGRLGLAFGLAGVAALSALPGCGSSKSSGGPPSDSEAQSARLACSYGPGALTSQTQGSSQPDGTAIPIDNIVIVMMENRSFDHYFEDLVNEGWSASDVDVAPAGTTNPGVDGGTPDVPLTHGTQLCFADTNHGWDGTHQEIDNGMMDGFVLANDGTHETPTGAPPDFLSGARAMVYYTKDDLPFMYWAASNFAIGDRYFASVPGPTYPNREYLYAASSYGETVTDITALPANVKSTVLDLLDQKKVTWSAYTDSPLPSFTLVESDPTSEGWPAHQFTMAQFATDAAAGKLPSVTFIDPNLLSEGYDGQDEHPPAVMQVGENWLAGLAKTLVASPQWAHMAFFVLYDEHGGLYDHVAPPAACAPDDIAPITTGSTYNGFAQYGVRLPFLTISPYAKQHYVGHMVYDHTSILRFIEARFGLPALTKRDANALAPFDVFDFKSPPNLTPPAVPDVPVDSSTISACQQIFTNSAVEAAGY